MSMNSQHAVEPLPHLGCDLLQLAWDCTAIGVAKAEYISAGFLGSFESTQGEIGFIRIAVEEMLGVVNHFPAMGLQVSHRIRDQLQILLLGYTQRPACVQLP